MNRNTLSRLIASTLMVAADAAEAPTATGSAPAPTNDRADQARLQSALRAALDGQNPEVAAMAGRIRDAEAVIPDIIADYQKAEGHGASTFAKLKGTFSNLKTAAEAEMLAKRIGIAFVTAGVRPDKAARKAMGATYKEPASFLLAQQHSSRIVAAFRKGVPGWQSMTLPELKDATREPTAKTWWTDTRTNIGTALSDARKRLRKGKLDADLAGLTGDALSNAQADQMRAKLAFGKVERAVDTFIAAITAAVAEMPEVDTDSGSQSDATTEPANDTGTAPVAAEPVANAA